MSNFSAKDVKALRDKTGVGMMDCKKALQEASGDLEQAILVLRKSGASKAAKKAGRVAAEGLVSVKVLGDAGVILEVNSETDFVAKNKSFVEFVNNVADTILKENPNSLEDLNNVKISGGSLLVREALEEKILAIGENIKIRRFERLNGNLVSYVHGGGKIGVLVQFGGDADFKDPKFLEYGRNIAMHIAAANPCYISSEDVPKDVLEKEESVYKEQLKELNKPDAVLSKIIKGKMGKFFAEVCLNEQRYVRDDSMSISEYTKSVCKDINADIKILKFIRMEKGEGIEKRSDNFADEVSGMLR